jgi:hypothetical protein
MPKREAPQYTGSASIVRLAHGRARSIVPIAVFPRSQPEGGRVLFRIS